MVVRPRSRTRRAPRDHGRHVVRRRGAHLAYPTSPPARRAQPAGARAAAASPPLDDRGGGGEPRPATPSRSRSTSTSGSEPTCPSSSPAAVRRPAPRIGRRPRTPRSARRPSCSRPADTLGAPGLPFPNYTFDAFVPGPSNRFAHAAAMAVAEATPSTAYNPLFIYGATGLGKTHLLIAVGHHMHRLTPGTRVKYVTSEQFVTEFIKAVRERKGDEFRQRYREVDVLLVDDMQFLAKREETQTEFFHTFNHLHGAGKQIVIASDRSPQRALGARGPPGEPLQVGPVRGRAAARPRDAHRDPAVEGRARPDRGAARGDRVRGLQVRPERPRARGGARARGRVVRAHQPADRRVARRARAAGPDPADRVRDPRPADPRGDGRLLPASPSTSSSRRAGHDPSRMPVISRCTSRARTRASRS